MAKRQTARERLLAFALSLPGAFEDHPWGERVAKVGRKVFVFGGLDDHPSGPMITLKLRESHGQALMAPGAEPTGYGLGRSGWVTVPLRTGAPPLDVLRDWVEESYRLVAPKTVVASHAEKPTGRRRSGR